MRWLEGITDLIDMSLSKLQEMVKPGEMPSVVFSFLTGAGLKQSWRMSKCKSLDWKSFTLYMWRRNTTGLYAKFKQNPENHC